MALVSLELSMHTLDYLKPRVVSLLYLWSAEVPIIRPHVWPFLAYCFCTGSLAFCGAYFILNCSDLSNSLVDCAPLEDRTVCVIHLRIPSALISMVSIG